MIKSNLMNSHFFILTAPRSGSTVLTRTLDQHPEIFCAGELFHPGDEIYHAEWHFPFWGTKKKKGISRKFFSITNYVNGYLFAVNHIKRFYAAREQNKKIRGFKLMIAHVKDFPTVWNYMRQNNFKVIILTRRNTFREALSSFRARQTGVFHGAGIDIKDGFIHFSTADQVKQTAALHFAGQTGLVLVAIDGRNFGDRLVFEPSRGGALFPHLYADLPLSAVLWEAPLSLDDAGLHIFPELAP